MDLAAIRKRAGALWWRLVASDPGLLRLGFAARGTVTAASALGVLYALGKFDGQPSSALFMAVVAALIASVMVNDPTPRQQKITTLMLPLPAAVTIALGSWLASSRIAGDAVFVGVIFVAVYLRRFGPRGFALGMFGFITYFFSLFLHARLTQLPWLMMALVIGIGCAYIMRFVLFPERPWRRIARMLRAFRVRVGRILDAVHDAIGSGADDDKARPMIRRRVAQMNETALMIEDELRSLTRGDVRAESDDDQNLTLRLFDIELAADRIAIVSREAPPASERATVQRMLHRLRQIANRKHQDAAAPDLTDIETLAKQPMRFALEDLQRALRDAPRAEALRDLRSETRTQHDQEHGENDDDNETQETEGLRFSTRQAIQVAVAGALAIAAGEFISPQRWYWSAITAFIVFTGTSSRGETLAKGWQRVAGTLFGVGAGILVATALNGHAGVSLGLIFVCIFLGFYFFQISYGLMIFWITIMLSLLYGMRGMFSVHLLLLRLEETAAGALIGVLVAIFVLPNSTREAVVQASTDYLQRLAAVVQLCGDWLCDHDRQGDPMVESHHLDQAFQQLREAANPLTRDLAGAFGGRRPSRRWLRTLLASRYHARRLARLSSNISPARSDAAASRLFDETTTRICAEIHALSQRPQPEDETDTAVEDMLNRLHLELRQSGSAQRDAARCLDHIHALVRILSRDFNIRRMRRNPDEKPPASESNQVHAS